MAHEKMKSRFDRETIKALRERSLSVVKRSMWERRIGWVRYIPSARRVGGEFAALSRQRGDYIIFNGQCMIGDLCYALCYLDALKKESGKKAAVLTNGYTKGIAACFSGVDRIVTFTENERFAWIQLAGLHLPNGFNAMSADGAEPFHLIDWNIRADVERDGSGLRDASLPEMHRVFQYRLPETAEMTYPDEALIAEQASLSSYEPFRNAVILNPYALSMPIEGMMPFMEQLAAEWSGRGYTVYTNVVGEQECVRGTLPLRCSVYDFYFAAKVSACVVSARTGLLDFCIHNGARYLTLYKDAWDGRFFPMYTLEAWKTKSRICEMIVPDTLDTEFLKKVNEAVAELIETRGMKHGTR